MDAIKPGPINERKVKGKQILDALRSVKQLEEEEELAKAAQEASQSVDGAENQTAENKSPK